VTLSLVLRGAAVIAYGLRSRSTWTTVSTLRSEVRLRMEEAMLETVGALDA